MTHYFGLQILKDVLTGLCLILNCVVKMESSLILKKINFAADIVEFAGFEITKESVRPCARFLKAITDFPTPESTTDVRS